VNPPFLKAEKNPGPTCNPMEYTNKISPNSFRKCNKCSFRFRLKCPKTMPTNKIQVTPREMPATFILPSIMPNAMTSDRISTECATPPPQRLGYPSNRFLKSSIV